MSCSILGGDKARRSFQVVKRRIQQYDLTSEISEFTHSTFHIVVRPTQSVFCHVLLGDCLCLFGELCKFLLCHVLHCGYFHSLENLCSSKFPKMVLVLVCVSINAFNFRYNILIVLTFLYGGSLRCWYPTTMGFPTKNDHFGVFGGYHHLRKHPYTHIIYIYIYRYLCSSNDNM